MKTVSIVGRRSMFAVRMLVTLVTALSCDWSTKESFADPVDVVVAVAEGLPANGFGGDVAGAVDNQYPL